FNGSFTLSSGTFTATSGTTTFTSTITHTLGGTFTHNSGTASFTGGSRTLDFNSTETFGTVSLTLNTGTGLTIAAGDTFIAVGNITINDGAFDSGTVEARGDITWGASADGANNTAVLKVTGTGDQTLTLAGGSGFRGTNTINKVTGNVYLGANYTTVSGAFTLTSGTFYTRNSANTNNYNLTTGNYSQSGGTFEGGASTIISHGNYSTFTLSGGTYNQSSVATLFGSAGWTHTAGGTFNHNSGATSFGGSSGTFDFIGTETFYSITATGDNNDVRTITSGDTLLVLSNATINQGGFATGTLEVRGDLTFASTADTSTALIKLSGTGDQTLTYNAGTLSGGVTVDKSTGNLYLGANLTVWTGTFTLTNGTMFLRNSAATNNYNLTLSNGAFTQTNGTFNGGSSTMSVRATFTLSGGTFNQSTGSTTYSSTFTHTAGGTFTHNSGTSIFSLDAVTLDFTTNETFGAVTMSASHNTTKTIATGDSMIVTGTLTLTDGRWATGTIEAQGDVTVGTGFDTVPGAPLKFTGGATQTFTLTGAEALLDADITVNKSGGAVNLASALTMNANSQDLIIQEGTFDLSSYALSVTAAATETLIVETGGNLQLQGGETITGDSASYPQLDSGSTVTYDGTSGPYTEKDYTYSNLTINGGATSVFTQAANESYGGNLTITQGIHAQGGFTTAVVGTFSNSGTLRRKQIETFTGTMDIDSGTVEYVGNGDGVVDTVTITDFGGAGTDYYNLKINDANATKDNFSNGAALTVAGTVEVASGTMTQSGSNAIAVTGTMTTNGGTFAGGSGAMSAGGLFTVSSGAFTATSGTMTLSNSFTFSGGTFTHNSGTVVFSANANHTITGSVGWNSLTLLDSSDNATDVVLTIVAGTTQTINGVLTLDGLDATDRLNIVSSVGASTATFDFQGTSSFSGDYLDVIDNVVSDNSSGLTIPVNPANSVNSFNTTNWFTPPGITVGAISGNTTEAGGTATFTLVLNAQPSADVSIGISSNDTTEGTVS
ncbi:MAG: hypothetical protein AAB558_04915, partial [Patescibacteria group bacterium]